MKNRKNPKLNNIVDNKKLKFLFIQLLIVITLIMSILMSLFIQYNGLDGEGIKNAYIISFIYIFEVEFNLISISSTIRFVDKFSSKNFRLLAPNLILSSSLKLYI